MIKKKPIPASKLMARVTPKTNKSKLGRVKRPAKVAKLTRPASLGAAAVDRWVERSDSRRLVPDEIAELSKNKEAS